MVPVGLPLATTGVGVMLSFQWNSLRTGDRVLVHDDQDPGLALHEGIVELVETGRWYTNDVVIQIDHDVPARVRPRRHAVHLLPLDRRSCWRCDAIAAHDAPSEAERPAA
jgi:hypothetical protein